MATIRSRRRAGIEKIAVATWPMRNWRRKSAGVAASFDCAKAETSEERLRLADRHEVERAWHVPDDGFDEQTAEARAAVRWLNDERGELPTSTPVDPDLHGTHDPVVIHRNLEPAPIEVARVEVRLMDETCDRHLSPRRWLVG